MMVLSLRPFFRGNVAKSKSLCFGSAGLSPRRLPEVRSLKKPLEHVSRSAANALRFEISRRPSRAANAARRLTRKPDAGRVFLRRSPATLLHVLSQAFTLFVGGPLLRVHFGARHPYEPR